MIKMKNIYLSFLGFLILVFFNIETAGSEDLNYIPAAREKAMGGAGVSLPDSSSSIAVNPGASIFNSNERIS
ncbi:MAG: hypothetical protein ACOC5R_01670, partial [Elusimicrobiota bacterium]